MRDLVYSGNDSYPPKFVSRSNKRYTRMVEKQYIVDAMTVQDSWRLFKILAELVDGFEKLSEMGPCVSIFGSARVLPGDDTYEKTVAVAKEHRVKQILLAGGVASNKLLRQRLVEDSPLPVIIPEPLLCTDNAAMIAACGYFHFKVGKIDILDLDIVPSLKLI